MVKLKTNAMYHLRSKAALIGQAIMEGNKRQFYLDQTAPEEELESPDLNTSSGRSRQVLTAQLGDLFV